MKPSTATHMLTGHGLPAKPPTTLARKDESGLTLSTAPSNQKELVTLAAGVSQGKSPGEAVAYALELWRESAAALHRIWEQEGIYTYDVSIAKSFAEVFQARNKALPLPDSFPATLDDFFRHIVKAKTPADCTKRLRDCLDDRYKNLKEKPPGAFTLERIKGGDKTGGFFTPALWRVMGSSYVWWWKDQKSKKARQSASKPKQKWTPLPLAKKDR